MAVEKQEMGSVYGTTLPTYETPMSIYASTILRKYFRKHKKNRGYTPRKK